MSSNSVCNHTRNLQIGLPLRGRPILLITHIITDRIVLHSVLLPLLILSQYYSKLKNLHLIPSFGSIRGSKCIHLYGCTVFCIRFAWKVNYDICYLQVSQSLGMKNEPSAYQIRYGGCKGMLAVDPTLPDGDSREILHLRRSMKKFESNHLSLEICEGSRASEY